MRRQFKLKEYLNNPEIKVVIDYGWPIEILSTNCDVKNGNGHKFPILALIHSEHGDFTHFYDKDGKYRCEGEIYCPGHELWFDDDYVPKSKVEEFVINKLSGVEPIDYAQFAEMVREIAKDEIIDSVSEIDIDELIDQMLIEITPETTLREICKNAMGTALIVAHNLTVNA